MKIKKRILSFICALSITIAVAVCALAVSAEEGGVILSTALSPAVEGMEYSFTLSASQGAIFLGVEGLPEGLSFDGGVLKGIPLKGGEYEIKFQAVGAEGMASLEEKVLTLSVLHNSACSYTPASPCEHVHDDSCGFAEAAGGEPCLHVCGDGNCSYAPATEPVPCKHELGEHDESCGYAEYQEGHECLHSHDQYCGGEIYCSHQHSDFCQYVEGIEEAPCVHEEHDEQCGYSAGSEEIPCDHSHNEQCGYVAPNLEAKCAHEHDEQCGYIAEIPCDYIYTEPVPPLEYKALELVPMIKGENGELVALEKTMENISDHSYLLPEPASHEAVVYFVNPQGALFAQALSEGEKLIPCAKGGVKITVQSGDKSQFTKINEEKDGGGAVYTAVKVVYDEGTPDNKYFSASLTLTDTEGNSTALILVGEESEKPADITFFAEDGKAKFVSSEFLRIYREFTNETVSNLYIRFTEVPEVGEIRYTDFDHPETELSISSISGTAPRSVQFSVNDTECYLIGSAYFGYDFADKDSVSLNYEVYTGKDETTPLYVATVNVKKKAEVITPPDDVTEPEDDFGVPVYAEGRKVTVWGEFEDGTVLISLPYVPTQGTADEIIEAVKLSAERRTGVASGDVKVSIVCGRTLLAVKDNDPTAEGKKVKICLPVEVSKLKEAISSEEGGLKKTSTYLVMAHVYSDGEIDIRFSELPNSEKIGLEFSDDKWNETDKEGIAAEAKALGAHVVMVMSIESGNTEAALPSENLTLYIGLGVFGVCFIACAIMTVVFIVKKKRKY